MVAGAALGAVGKPHQEEGKTESGVDLLLGKHLHQRSTHAAIAAEALPHDRAWPDGDDSFSEQHRPDDIVGRADNAQEVFRPMLKLIRSATGITQKRPARHLFQDFSQL